MVLPTIQLPIFLRNNYVIGLSRLYTISIIQSCVIWCSIVTVWVNILYCVQRIWFFWRLCWNRSSFVKFKRDVEVRLWLTVCQSSVSFIDFALLYFPVNFVHNLIDRIIHLSLKVFRITELWLDILTWRCELMMTISIMAFNHRAHLLLNYFGPIATWNCHNWPFLALNFMENLGWSEFTFLFIKLSRVVYTLSILGNHTH